MEQNLENNSQLHWTPIGDTALIHINIDIELCLHRHTAELPRQRQGTCWTSLPAPLTHLFRSSFVKHFDLFSSKAAVQIKTSCVEPRHFFDFARIHCIIHHNILWQLPYVWSGLIILGSIIYFFRPVPDWTIGKISFVAFSPFLENEG